MRNLPLLLLCLLPCFVFAKKQPNFQTTDIRNFWAAFDKLAEARTHADSVRIIQVQYIDKATPDFRKFIRKRDFTAAEYVQLIGKHPKFWKSIRPLTERIESRKAEVLAVFDQFSELLPGWDAPDICFAIGCLRTGGTTKRGLILIGAEIAAADSTVDKSELNNWMKGVMGKTGDIVAMVAHEAVHTQQRGMPWREFFSMAKHGRMRLLNTAIVEGSADFITRELLGLNINANVYDYGEAHYCALAKEFREAIAKAPFDYSKWLYNGNNSKARPADLGYYMGCKIAEAFYKNSPDKQAALRLLLKRGKYKEVFKISNFEQNGCG